MYLTTNPSTFIFNALSAGLTSESVFSPDFTIERIKDLQINSSVTILWSNGGIQVITRTSEKVWGSSWN
tara:strand:+ start:1031 stop:1237 length:207 start_codon:yes stop_codon:yes gene_type:complete